MYYAQPNAELHSSGWRFSRDGLEEEHQEENVLTNEGGKLERRKYVRDFLREPVGNVWVDINPAMGNERVGYPTQKPIALLDRIIRASSKEGDTVLDPFCGCATALVSAELLRRKWIGIDLSPKAAELVVSRLQNNDTPLDPSTFTHTTSNPIRTDIEREMAVTHSERESLKRVLYSNQDGLCNLCHVAFENRNLELDHIVPKSKGGQDWVDNFQLLCGNCNRIKSDGTQEQARARLAKNKGIDLSVFN